MNIDVDLREELKDSRKKQDAIINSRISNTKMLLAENESNRITVLKALGLDEGIKEYEEAKSKDLDRIKIEKDYGKDVFHRDEIRNLCIKYDLRFLGSKNYNGPITNELPEKVIEFANKHKLRIGLNGDTWSGDANNFKILAPREKFKENRSKRFKRKDKDPILFYSLENNHYKMVYAWGNSLTMTRLIKGIFRRNAYSRMFNVTLLSAIIIVPLLGWLGLNFILSFLVGGVLSFLISLMCNKWDGNGSIKNTHPYYTVNGWNCSYDIKFF